MNAIKTSAFVEDNEHLRLINKLKKIAQGTQVDLILITPKKITRETGKKSLQQSALIRKKNFLILATRARNLSTGSSENFGRFFGYNRMLPIFITISC